jgi:hypothetical protein
LPPSLLSCLWQIYIFPSLFLCIYHAKLAKETFSSLRDDDVVQKYRMSDPARRGNLGFCGWISPPTVAHSCLPTAEMSWEIASVKITQLPVIPWNTLYFPVSILLVTNSSSELFAGCCRVPSVTHLWS